MAKFLDGILVLDFSRVLAGPFCTMTLADLGARVIKVEPPEGDEARGMGPFRNGQSLYFASINRGKESVVLDLKHPEGLEIARRLVTEADVLVENFRPGAIGRLGLDYESASKLNPAIVYLSLSGFGQNSPYKDRGAYDIIIQAMSGLMGITGSANGSPTRVGASVGDLIPALYAVAGVLAGLYRREVTGDGSYLDIAMLDSVVAVVENALARHWVSGRDPSPLGNRHPAIAPFSTFATADEQIVIACGNDALWTRLCTAIGAPELTIDPRFASNALRTENVNGLAAELGRVLASRSAGEWLEILLHAGIPCAPVNKMSDLLRDPSLRARNMIVEVEHPAIGRMPAPGAPIKSNAHEDGVSGRVPDLGSDTATVLSDFLHFGQAEISRLAGLGAIGGKLAPEGN